MNEVTRESIVDAARAAFAQTSGTLSVKEFVRISGLSREALYRLFPDGGWTKVREIVGIPRHPYEHAHKSDGDLLIEFHTVATELGAIPTWGMFRSKSSIHHDMLRKRFGGIQGTLKAYREWLEANAPDSPLLAELHVKSKHEIARPPRQVASEPIRPAWSKIEGIEFGAPISFRGLRHAPINEQGVVYLFGMVSYEIGLIVEAVQTGFPDCEAKRCVNAREDRWQRVRVEFEFRSRNFKDHCHDASKCDLIVCWEHDWPECPLEVIELRTVIDRLDS